LDFGNFGIAGFVAFAVSRVYGYILMAVSLLDMMMLRAPRQGGGAIHVAATGWAELK
jgi:hypothetical protein